MKRNRHAAWLFIGWAFVFPWAVWYITNYIILEGRYVSMDWKSLLAFVAPILTGILSVAASIVVANRNIREKLVEKLNALNKKNDDKHAKLSNEHSSLSRDHTDIQKALSSAQADIHRINDVMTDEKRRREIRDEVLLQSTPDVKQASEMMNAVFLQLQDAHQKIGELQGEIGQLRAENNLLRGERARRSERRDEQEDDWER